MHAQAKAPRRRRFTCHAGIAWPDTVAGYAVRPVVAKLPDGLGELGALIVDEAAGTVQEEVPEWVPAEWLSPVMGDDSVSDIYGAIGVWPAAFLAAQMLIDYSARHNNGPWSCLEVGCGAGFPSLVAARLGARVYALDSEQLPLDLLREAFARQQSAGCVPLAASLDARCADASNIEEHLLAAADVIVVSDLLYSVELGEAVGRQLGLWLRSSKDRFLILSDGGRSGRAAFLEAFRKAADCPEACFEDQPVPSWAVQRADFFDGVETTTVGRLRW